MYGMATNGVVASELNTYIYRSCASCTAAQAQATQTQVAETLASANTDKHTAEQALAVLKLEKASVDSALAALQLKTSDLQRQNEVCLSQKVAAEQASADYKAQKEAAEQASADAKAQKEQADQAATTACGLRDAAQSTHIHTVHVYLRILLCDNALLRFHPHFTLYTHTHNTRLPNKHPTPSQFKATLQRRLTVTKKNRGPEHGIHAGGGFAERERQRTW